MKRRQGLLAAYFVVCTLMLVWPGYAWLGNHIEPWILGLPLSFAWNVAWVVLTLLVLTAYHLAGSEEG